MLLVLGVFMEMWGKLDIMRILVILCITCVTLDNFLIFITNGEHWMWI